jgi:Ribbon-helix-helix protein, copG family
MQTSKRRVRVTVTLSPRLVKLVDERARHREDKSRSATIESMLTQAALEEQVKAYYAAPDEVRDADEAFWEEVGRVSASLGKKPAPRKKPAGRR